MALVQLKDNNGAALSPRTVADVVIFSDDKNLNQKMAEKLDAFTPEVWTFELEDGTSVTRNVYAIAPTT